MDTESYDAWVELVTQLVATRNKRGLSQTEVARRVGTEQGCISRWETLRVRPSVAHLISWARAVGVNVKLEET